MSLLSLHDKSSIATFASHNPFQHIYEIGDLDDFFWPHTQWYGWQPNSTLQQLALLYVAQPSLPTLLANAEAPFAGMVDLLNTLLPLLPRRLYAHLHPSMGKLFAAHYQIESHGVHFRMGQTQPKHANDISTDDVVLLDASHISAIKQLYGAAYPDNWFDPRNLQTNAYFGIWHKDTLASIAGVHVYAKDYGVAAIGNVTTLPALRGKGLALRTCAKLCQVLRQRGIHTIGLNVKADNTPALTTYGKLGFEKIAEYEEFLFHNETQ